jgi:agmatinase
MGGIDGDVWKLPYDRSQDPTRAPGPIHLERAVGQLSYAGIPTFMGVPICLTQDDLRAGRVDAAVLGAPVDMSVGMRGASWGPRRIRSDERTLPHTPYAFLNPDTRVKPFEVLKVVDYGDAPVDPFSIENSMEPIRTLVREIAEVGAIPIVLGGDHSIMWPNAAGVADVYGAGKVGIIHFDSHTDCATQVFGHSVTHGTPIRRLIEDEHVPARNFIQVGLHSYLVNDDELLAWMRKNGMRSHFMAEIDRIGFEAVLEKAIAEALDGPEYIYISLDIDVLDPAYAPATGTPEAGGLTPRELLPAIRRICHETQVVGLEVVEVAPLLDPGYTTAMYARRAILEALSGIAQRRLGLPGPKYLHPLVSGEDPTGVPAV